MVNNTNIDIAQKWLETLEFCADDELFLAQGLVFVCSMCSNSVPFWNMYVVLRTGLKEWVFWKADSLYIVIQQWGKWNVNKNTESVSVLQLMLSVIWIYPYNCLSKKEYILGLLFFAFAHVIAICVVRRTWPAIYIYN